MIVSSSILATHLIQAVNPQDEILLFLFHISGKVSVKLGATNFLLFWTRRGLNLGLVN